MEMIGRYFSDLQQTLDQLDQERIAQAIRVLHEARLHGRKIFIMGNGGSASTASHFVCDLSKNTRRPGWRPFRVIGLADNMASFSAYGNDEGYDQVFAQQLASLVEPEDVVIAISTSGRSPNVLRAVEVARANEAFTIGFTGFNGGDLRHMVDLELYVPSDCIEHVEDIHLILEHLMCKQLREMAEAAPEAASNGHQEQPVSV